MAEPEVSDESGGGGRDFLRSAVAQDLRDDRWPGLSVVTRFPPEPNGFLHIGHAKAICLDFAIARENGGACNLRFDDTNPSKEESRYVDAMKEDLRWLGFDWGDREFFASDYFEQLFQWAIQLIEGGKAYVCDLSPDETREYRGTLNAPGRNSPFRDRSVEENLDLFKRMRVGEFDDGSRTLRAKIDMASPNMNLRDPVMYRLMKAPHHRTGDQWSIYPMYDWAHGQSDSIEKVTHSLCSLEFENHRPLYDWYVEQLGIHHPRQIEFARLNLTYTITSKRGLRRLVDDGHVSGWDDPRMPTLKGFRRLGYPPRVITAFCDKIGVNKTNSLIDRALLESVLREDLNANAERRLAVLRPLKVVVENYPEGQVEEFDAVNNPEDPSAAKRKIPFSRELFIERDDFMEDAPKKFFRLAPGREVRFRYAYYLTCTDVVKDASGEVVELRCSYDPESRGGNTADGRKVKGTIHWVSAAHAVDAEVRLYDHLFREEQPSSEDITDDLNPDSLKVLKGCKLEPSLAELGAELPVQFERLGYFVTDSDSRADALVFNRTVGLRDSWAKIAQKMAPQKNAKQKNQKQKKKNQPKNDSGKNPKA